MPPKEPSLRGTLRSQIAAERLERAPHVAASAVVALSLLIATLLQNLQLMRPSAAIVFTLWSIAAGLNLVLIWWWTRSRRYSLSPWLDLPIMLPFVFWMDRLRAVIASEGAINGWPDFTTATGNGLLALTFASAFFAANFWGFAIWCAVHAAVFTGVILQTNGSAIAKSYAFSVYIPVLAGLLYFNWSIWRKGLAEASLRDELQHQKTRVETLLFNLLPEDVAVRLQRGEAVADAYSDVSVIFIDLVDSAQLATLLSPKAFIAVLNDIFSLADCAAESEGVEKVKTIGDAYLAVAGAHTGADARNAIRFAHAVIEGVTRIADERRLPLSVRAGVHSGPVVGGVIGETRATYDYWGNTMNVAARVQSAATVGGIAVTEPVYYASRDEQSYGPPRTVLLKGIGNVTVYDAIIKGEPTVQ